ncbi:MAG: hypothetical protein PF541_14085 [Prolixibacteraceae bacterium]|nr:hypothetical protein [Prolixibacteraceae bacterium]
MTYVLSDTSNISIQNPSNKYIELTPFKDIEQLKYFMVKHNW